jgi:hypothetical protein
MDFSAIVNLVVMPEANDDNQYSPYQGFTLELCADPQYISLLSLSAIYPQNISEIFLNQNELIHFRNNQALPNFMLIGKNSLAKHVEFLKHFPFVIITCHTKDLEFVRGVVSVFRFKPIVASFADSADVILNDKFGIFSFDKFLFQRFNEVKAHPAFQEFLTRSGLSSFTNVREHFAIDKGFISIRQSVTNATESVLSSLGYVFSGAENVKSENGRDGYIDVIINSAKILLAETKEKAEGSKSDLILYSPSIARHLYRFGSNFWNQQFRKIKEPNVKAFVINGIFKNPNYSGFQSVPFENPYENPDVQPILVIRQGELALTLSAVRFLSIYHNSPAIRLPNSVNFHTPQFKDIEYLVASKAPSSKRKLQSKFKELINQLSDEIGQDLISFVNENSGSITLCTDVAVEWVHFNRIPLMFSHEVSKIHTTSGNHLLKQASMSINIDFTKEELLDVTVIRSFQDDDQIKPILEYGISHFVNIDKKVKVKIVDVSSKTELQDALSKVTSQILIFDCHGDHGGGESSGWLRIGIEKIKISDLEIDGALPPIIILSACLTSAISGSHDSVANGLLEAGAVSVLGTLLHVDAVRSSMFVGRLLYRLTGYLDMLSGLGVNYLTWRQFVSGFFRMSFCTDITIDLLEKKTITLEQYEQINMKANFYINSNNSLWFDKFVEEVANLTKMTEEQVFDGISELGLTETMHYSQIGRPENIRISLDE